MDKSTTIQRLTSGPNRAACFVHRVAILISTGMAYCHGPCVTTAGRQPHSRLLIGVMQEVLAPAFTPMHRGERRHLSEDVIKLRARNFQGPNPNQHCRHATLVGAVLCKDFGEGGSDGAIAEDSGMDSGVM